MLRVDNLSVQYGAFRALQDVSLNVDEGLIVSIVGANGAGKTTLLNTVSGLLQPVSGHVYMDADELTGLAGHDVARKGIVQVPEGRKLFPDMTVKDNLLTASMYGDAKKRRAESMQEVYELFPVLKQREQQLARTLSGGEQQMLAIGRGVMAKPRLLMLDEPSLGLAPLLVRQMFEVAKELKRRGLTVLLVEQNVRQSLLVADYAYVMEVGRVALHGPAQEILHDEHIRKAYLGR